MSVSEDDDAALPTKGRHCSSTTDLHQIEVQMKVLYSLQGTRGWHRVDLNFPLMRGWHIFSDALSFVLSPRSCPTCCQLLFTRREGQKILVQLNKNYVLAANW